MTVLIEAVTLIVKNEAVIDKFKGRFKRLLKIIPTQMICSDNKLISMIFLSDSEALKFIQTLEKNGLIHVNQDGYAQDMILLDQNGRVSALCTWLTVGTSIIGSDESKVVQVCCLKGDEGSKVFFPDGWEYETSLSKNGYLTGLD